MSQFWGTKSFKKLSKLWDKKLEKSGFVDAEKKNSKNSIYKLSQVEKESRLEYFSVIGNLANNTDFSNDVDSFVMIKHAEGLTIKEILEKLYKEKKIRRCRETVRYIIRRWQNKWGIKAWSQKKMNLKKLDPIK